MDPTTRMKMIRHVYKHTPKDYRHKKGGEHHIMHMGPQGTTISNLHKVSDEELRAFAKDRGWKGESAPTLRDLIGEARRSLAPDAEEQGDFGGTSHCVALRGARRF